MKDTDLSLSDDDPLNLEEPDHKDEQHSLIRTTKTVLVKEEMGTGLDPAVISPRFYNAFNHTLVAHDQPGMSITIGVTSAHPGEGKTTVASNLAVSTAVANERDTILVDFSPRSPRLHMVFGTDIRPGLAEGLTEPNIQVTRTKIKHLFVLTLGNVHKLGIAPETSQEKHSRSNGSVTQSSLMFLPNFRDVLYSLQMEFGFVIVDLPALNDAIVPVLFAQQLNGLLIVVDASRTKKEHVDQLVNRCGIDRVRGFVLNRVVDI
jgi:Mrp family chromosome partitioning ATPase